jgi:hypothetical protein
MSKDGATKLAAYTQQATADFDRWSLGYRDRVCGQAANLRAGGQEALAQFFEQSRATSAALRRRYLDEARTLLIEVDKERFDHLLSADEHGPKVHFIPGQPDTATLARTGVLTVEGVLKRNECGTTEETQK